MAKKTSKKKKKTTQRKPVAAGASSVKSGVKSGGKSGAKKQAAGVKPASVKKAATKAAGSGAGGRKALTAKSSASAALAAVEAYQTNHHNNGHDAEETIEWTEAKLRKVKTDLKKKDLEHLGALLIEKRGEILGDVASIQSANSGGAGNLSNMPLHMADVGSDNYEQEFALGLVEWERRLLNEIDNAIERIDRGYYGVCLESGVPIPRERLEIKPWAKYTIEVVRERERRGLPT